MTRKKFEFSSKNFWNMAVYLLNKKKLIIFDVTVRKEFFIAKRR